MKLFKLDELKKFRDESVDHIHFMSKWCHLTKIESDKIRFREIKRRWLKLLDDHNLIDHMCYQMTPTNDKLIWFHVGERSFHQRAKHYPTTRQLEVHPEIHLKDDEISIDTKCKKGCWLRIITTRISRRLTGSMSTSCRCSLHTQRLFHVWMH